MKIKRTLTSCWLILLFFVVFLLRLPSLFEPFTYGDEGIYLALGQALRKGLVWYRDIHDNKPPLLYLLAALTENFSYYRVLLFAWSLVTIYVFLKLAEKIFPKNKKAVIISTFTFAILTSIHKFEGNVANAENFMMLPATFGMFLLIPCLNDLNRHKIDLIKWVLVGMMFSLATLFKVPAAFDFLAVLAFLFFVFFKNRKINVLRIAYCVLPFLIGFLLPILITVIYYASQSALSQYLQAAFLQNIPYLTSWGAGPQSGFNPFRSGLFIRGIVLLAAGCWLLVAGKKLSQKFLLVALWFAFSLFAALLSARPYPHYLIQVLPSLSLLAGFLTLRVRKEKLFVLLCFSLFAFSFYFYRFWVYKNIPYYTNFYQYALGQKTKQEYFADFDPKANDVYQAAEFVVSHALFDEKIFIWGNEPFIYALSRHLPSGRYTVAYHIIDFDGWQETIEAIEKDKTGLIITAPVAGHDFPAMEKLLKGKYIKIGEVGEFDFYRLMKADVK